MRPSQVLNKPCLVALRRIIVVGIKSVTSRYCANYGVVVWARIVFSKISDFCVSRGTFHIPVCLLLVPFIIFCPVFWTDVYFLSSGMVHPSPNNTPNDVSGDVFIFGEM